MGAHDHQPLRTQAQGSDGGGVRHIAVADPQRRLVSLGRQPAQQHGGKGRDSAVADAVDMRGGRHFVQAAQRQTTPRQDGIHFRQTQRHRAGHGFGARPFQGGNASAQTVKIGG